VTPQLDRMVYETTAPSLPETTAATEPLSQGPALSGRVAAGRQLATQPQVQPGELAGVSTLRESRDQLGGLAKSTTREGPLRGGSGPNKHLLIIVIKARQPRSTRARSRCRRAGD